MMQRRYNMHSHCFILYSFSCVLFATGASKIVWGLLLVLRIVYSKKSIRDSMLQVGRRITCAARLRATALALSGDEAQHVQFRRKRAAPS